MTTAEATTGVGGTWHARRNALLLSVAAAFSGGISVVSVSLGGLAGSYLLDADKSLATLPVSGFNIGVALGTIPAALLMRRVGRRAGFLSGVSVAIFGGLIAGYAVLAGSFVLFALGLLTVGFSASFAQQYRFAAADVGSAAFRARAISWVLTGGIAAAVIGPQTVIFTRNLLSPIPFAGSFFAIGVLALAAMAILSQLTGEAREPPPQTEQTGGRRLSEIARQPRFIVAILCAMGSYALMSLLMTAAPLAIVGCGLGQDNAALGIQWHVLAMFGPSYVTGHLIARYGKEPVIAIGMGLLALCAGVAHRRRQSGELLGGADSARPRLEFRLHRRHRHADRDLPAGREEHGAGAQRFSGLRFGGAGLAVVRQALRDGGLGTAQSLRFSGHCGLPGGAPGRLRLEAARAGLKRSRGAFEQGQGRADTWLDARSPTGHTHAGSNPPGGRFRSADSLDSGWARAVFWPLVSSS